jgi:hypothetical protein
MKRSNLKGAAMAIIVVSVSTLIASSIEAVASSDHGSGDHGMGMGQPGAVAPREKSVAPIGKFHRASAANIARVLRPGSRRNHITPADCNPHVRCILYCPGGQGRDASGNKFCYGASCVITDFGVVCD